MKTTLFFAFSVAALVAGCGNNNNTGTDMGGNTGDMAPAADPVKPALATTQIERMGRATINVAVTNPFDLDYTKGLDGTTTIYGGTSRNETRDKHSKDGNVAMWGAVWTPIIARTLAIYDGAESGTACGNQLGACGKATGCAGTDPKNFTRYNALAGVLADDQLYMDTTKADCSFYLAVEAAQGLSVTQASGFCGGRLPNSDVVDTMYTSATIGAAPLLAGSGYVTDGVASEPSGETRADQNTFPFLGAPNQ